MDVFLFESSPVIVNHVINVGNFEFHLNLKNSMQKSSSIEKSLDPKIP